MKKSLILLILPLFFAAGCGDDRSPVIPPDPLSPEEAQVVANCYTVQQAAEDWAALSGGFYPVDIGVHRTPSGETLTDLLPGGVLLENPFTNIATEPVTVSAAANPGETAYFSEIQGGLSVGYTIMGYGENELIITISKRP